MSLKLGALAAALVAGSVFVISQPGGANAKPEFAAATGKPCASCHQNPSGGGPLKPYGEAFRANGYKLKK